MKKIAVIINKNWETEPILNSITNPELKPLDLPFPNVVNFPKDGKNKMKVPRAVFLFDNSQHTDSKGNVSPNLEVSVYCIQDLMFIDSKTPPHLQSTSSSSEKNIVLANLFTESLKEFDLIIAMGTAGYPCEGFPIAGSVVVGGTFFVKNGNSNNPKSIFRSDKFNQVLLSNVNEELFHPGKGVFNQTFKNTTESKFIPVPNHRAEKMVCIASSSYCALSFVNVTEYAEYGWADEEAVDDYKYVTRREPLSSDRHRNPIGSIETTHGIIKLNTELPIIFISAITDNLGNFNTEVTPSQNYSASFNAGIVLGQLLCSLNYRVEQGFDFKKK